VPQKTGIISTTMETSNPAQEFENFLLYVYEDSALLLKSCGEFWLINYADFPQHNPTVAPFSPSASRAALDVRMDQSVGTLFQWRTQNIFGGGEFARNFFRGGSTNSVEERGQRERRSGGGSPPVRGATY
jgi:hypothetical protein